ncbi:MAG: D-alanine--D-alanine ligase [Candidatus Omnitrophica bacterium]|nr:D-alanine--D-alanine ligase [Candidatus Omnitrophota bacterium]MDD5352788.1 D-alanine--D-alanine ligase [Candidatus Omnitrophota bacterium]MDD5550387.1 D-alanine--D-alanine ligase [Candidatus Omnitrophota bacterium]
MYSNLGKIGVIFGGLSSEREISVKSGKAVCEALINEGLNVREIDLTTEEPDKVEEIIHNFGIDVAFIAMHGRFGEDGKLQAILEKMNITYVGSDSLASALAMDKIASRSVFEENNIPVPKCKVLNIEKRNSLLKKELQLPLVVKPQSQGSSIGVSFVQRVEELGPALDSAFGYDNNIIIEEYIQGKELTVGILDDKALEPIQIVPKNIFFDYKAKYNKGMTEYMLPAPLDADLRNKVQAVSLKAHKALGCRHFSRVDLLLDKDNNPFVLEINTIPGFTATSLLPKAALYEGITFTQLCIKLITLALKDAVPTLNR